MYTKTAIFKARSRFGENLYSIKRLIGLSGSHETLKQARVFDLSRDRACRCPFVRQLGHAAGANVTETILWRAVFLGEHRFQARQPPFTRLGIPPSCGEFGPSAEKALTDLIQEAYIQGIWTRAVDNLVKAMR